MPQITTRTPDDFSAELETFFGTERYFRHPFGGLLYTDGVFHAASKSEGVLYDGTHACSGALRLIHDIAIRQPEARERCPDFQLWTLAVEERGPMRGAVLTCRADSDEEPVITERYAWTDFPLPKLTLYVMDNVLLLPGEY